MADMDADELEQFALQPSCPTCGTVMRDVPGGFVCSTCNAAYRYPWVGDVE